MTKPSYLSFVLISFLLWASHASAADCARADASLAGHYYMHGVMEVGSELRLQANGQFDYMLAYGALDELASGCWSRAGRFVTLITTTFQANSDDRMKFERLVLEVTPSGKLIRRFDVHQIRTYSRR